MDVGRDCDAEVPVAPEPAPSSWAMRAGIILAMSFFFELLWLAYVCHNSVAEILIGAAASILSAVAGFAAYYVASIDVRPRWVWVAQIWRLPGLIIVETGQVVRWIVRASLGLPFDGQLRSAPFEADSSPA